MSFQRQGGHECDCGCDRRRREAGQAVQDDGLDPLATPTSHDWRLLLWQGHGHDGLYGDDGEMQCNQYPPADFRRDHIDSLLAHIDWSLQSESGQPSEGLRSALRAAPSPP